MFRNQKGFTLIELMAVLAILAIIVAIAVPAVGSILAKSEVSADASSRHLIEKAGENAYVSGLGLDEDDRYSVMTLIAHGYLALDEGKKLNDPTSYVERQSNGLFRFVSIEPNEITDFRVVDRGDGTVGITGYDLSGMTHIDIPGTINRKTVTELVGTTHNGSLDAFTRRGLTSVTIPDSVTKIGDYVFANNILTEVVLPNSLTEIGDRAFASNNLTSVTLSNSLETLGGYSFAWNKLTSLTVPNSVREIGDNSFASNSLTSVTLSDSLETIGNHSFAWNNVRSISIPSTTKTIGASAFYANSIANVTIPKSVESIGDWSFGHMTGLKTVTIRNPNMVIGASAFSVFDAKETGKLRIYGFPGSTAEKFAKSNITMYSFSAIQ